MRGERRKKDILNQILAKSYKNFNIGHFETRIFAIRLCVPTKAIEVLKSNMYGWKQCKKI